MAAHSKFHRLSYSCYEVGHCWNPSCLETSLEITKFGLIESLKIYTPIYLIRAILNGRGKEYYIKQLLPEIVRSSLFLTTNAGLFISGFCVWRLLGRANMLTLILPTGLQSSFLAILVERPKRRGMLAMYVSTIALEMIINMLLFRKMIRPVKHGQIALFSFISSIYMYLYCRGSLSGASQWIHSSLRQLVGPSECRTEPPARLTSSVPIRPTKRRVVVDDVIELLKTLRTKLRQGSSKHVLCPHPDSCVSYVAEGIVRPLGIGYAISAALKLVSSLPQLFRRPGRVLRSLLHKDNFTLAAFLGSFTGIFRLSQCLLRRVRNSNSPNHALLSGFLSGWSMLFYPSTSIALYLATKLVEILYFKGIHKGMLPYVRYADVMLYTIATALILHVAVFEPHNMRPAYWRFIEKLTHKRFNQMNRKLLEGYGTHASHLFPDFWPKYDPRYSSLKREDFP